MDNQMKDLLNLIKELRSTSDNEGTNLPLYEVHEEKIILSDDTDLADVKVVKAMLSYWNQMKFYTIEEINNGIMSEDMLLSRSLTDKLRYCETIDEALDNLHKYFAKDEVRKGGLIYEDCYRCTFLSKLEAKKYINENIAMLENPYIKVTSASDFEDSTLTRLLKLLDK